MFLISFLALVNTGNSKKVTPEIREKLEKYLNLCLCDRYSSDCGDVFID